jgi:hypothetical protein
MRLRGVPGGRAGLHVRTQRDQPLRAVRGRELPVRGVRVRQLASCLHAMHACSGRGAGIQTGKELKKKEKMCQMRKVYQISKKASLMSQGRGGRLEVLPRECGNFPEISVRKDTSRKFTFLDR